MSKKQKFRETLYQIELLKRKKVQKLLLDMGLTPGQGQARILSFLSAHSPVSQKEIADACFLDVTTMSRTLDKMERQGLLRRERDPKCRRTYQVELTEEGAGKAKEVETGFRHLEEFMCSGIPDEELEGMIRGLGKIRENLLRDEKENEKLQFTPNRRPHAHSSR